MGSVSFVPMTNSETMSSSNEMKNAKTAAASIAGRIDGSVT